MLPSLLFPRSVALHPAKCPRCNGALGSFPDLVVSEGVVRAGCPDSGCSGSGVAVYWVGI